MKQNLESTGGLIFSGQLLLDLAEAGMLREDAYRLVQSPRDARLERRSQASATKSRATPKIAKLLSQKKLARTFDYSRQLGNVDAIFKTGIGAMKKKLGGPVCLIRLSVPCSDP